MTCSHRLTNGASLFSMNLWIVRLQESSTSATRVPPDCCVLCSRQVPRLMFGNFLVHLLRTNRDPILSSTTPGKLLEEPVGHHHSLRPSGDSRCHPRGLPLFLQPSLIALIINTSRQSIVRSLTTSQSRSGNDWPRRQGRVKLAIVAR